MTLTTSLQADLPPPLDSHLCDPCKFLFETSFKIRYPNVIYYENGAPKPSTRMPSKEEQEGPLWQHWPTAYDFAHSASEGCHFCRLLWLQLAMSERDGILNNRANELDKAPGTSSVMWYPNQQIAKYRMTAGYKVGDKKALRLLSLHLKPAFGMSGHVLSTHKHEWIYEPLSHDNADQICDFSAHELRLDDMWKVASDWMTNCATKHESCMRSTMDHSATRPSRLIFVEREMSDYAIRLK